MVWRPIVSVPKISEMAKIELSEVGFGDWNGKDN